MTKGWIAALALFVLCLASCSSAATSIGTSGTSKPKGLTSNPKAEPPIKSILLTTGELPSGWAVDTGGNGRYVPTSCGTDTPLRLVDPDAYAGVTFSQTANSAIELFEEVAFSDTPESSLNTLEGKLNACRTFTLPTSQGASQRASGTITPVSFPRYATQQAGFLISIPLSFPGFPSEDLQQGFIIVQKGRYLVYLGYFPSSVPFNTHQLAPIIPVALAKVPSS